MGLTLLGRDADADALLRGRVGAALGRALVQHAVGGVRAGGGGAERGREAVRRRSASTTPTGKRERSTVKGDDAGGEL